MDAHPYLTGKFIWINYKGIAIVMGIQTFGVLGIIYGPFLISICAVIYEILIQ